MRIPHIPVFFALTIAILLPSTVIPLAAQRGAREPKVILLWPDGAPGAKGNEAADQPTLDVYIPSEGANGAAVVVFPGGGYRHLAVDHEGQQIARWLNSFGVAAFVLKYRLGPRYHHPIQMGDAHRALRHVRLHAAEFGVDPGRLGVWGFSAGGHLASTAATHFDRGDAAAAEPIDRMSSRPDFAILAYPVISLTTEYTHQGSKRHLLGDNPDPSLVEYLSSELQVTPETPPTFLFHTNEDTGVAPENSVLFYLGLRKAGVPAELHIYERGRHGVGLAATDRVLSTWPQRLSDWLYSRGILTR